MENINDGNRAFYTIEVFDHVSWRGEEWVITEIKNEKWGNSYPCRATSLKDGRVGYPMLNEVTLVSKNMTNILKHKKHESTIDIKDLSFNLKS